MARTLAPLADPGRPGSGRAAGSARASSARADSARAGSAPADSAPADWGQADWAQASAPQLWRFHLHYWDWAWELAAEPDREQAGALFATLWRSWRGTVVPGRGDAWRPYPAALRAWSYCGLHHDLVAGSEIEDCFVADLAAHAGFLRRHLESDVGGNHLVKNLKALIGLAVFFADDQLVEETLSRLSGQLAVQILADGGHYERAPAYHCQVLADLIDIGWLLRDAGRPPWPGLPEVIRGMRRWLGAVLFPGAAPFPRAVPFPRAAALRGNGLPPRGAVPGGGSVPLLNDGFPVSTKLLAAVRPVPQDGPLLVLPDTGLVRATAGGWQLLADVGAPCPDELPAHAHADTFSCLVHVDGAPLLVDTGTSTYAAGPRRSYERSTAAHNTVEVDGTDSTEVWGAFRAARRARVGPVATGVGSGAVTIEASHDGYRRLPGRPCHRRRWSLTERGLYVADVVTGRGRHSVVVRWHLPPGSTLRLITAGAEVTTPAGEFQVTVTASEQVTLGAGTAPVATGFGRAVDAPVLTAAIDAVLPVQVDASWHRAGGRRRTA